MRASFSTDILPESAHPEIMQYLLEHNVGHYVEPAHDPQARLGVEGIKRAFGIPDADIHYMPNGTITNVTALSCMLKPFEGVISPVTGHINNYEAGAFEATGHKIIPVAAPDGKLTPAGIDAALDGYKGYDTVKPGAVYLTQVTEEGTVYDRDELSAVINHAKRRGLHTYLDGARLAMALASRDAGMTMQEFGQLDLDLFYIGGTKNGGLYGEALVIKNEQFKPDFDSYMKRQGAHMGKQRPMALQFARFFGEDNLWLRLGEQANDMGERLRQGLAAVAAELALSGQANHAFVALKNEDADTLEQNFKISRWRKIDAGTTLVRLVCSWATTGEEVEALVGAVKNACHTNERDT